jgi:hypothetical protein
MSLRLGVDLDGTLADLSSLYREVERQIDAESPGLPVEACAQVKPEAHESATPKVQPSSDKDRLKAAKQDSRKHRAVWQALRTTPDLWLQLKPIEEGAVRRLYETSIALNWEVFFITQRPRSEGASVQRQTQQWLIEQGFGCPSVLTLRGPRGKAAYALDLDFLLDDLAQNCVDVVADSKCRPLLVLRKPDDAAEAVARQLKIGVVRSIHEALDLLSEPEPAPRETMVKRVLKSLGLA